MSVIYKVFNESFWDVLLTTTDFQAALDCWSAGSHEARRHMHWTILVEESDKLTYLKGEKEIKAYAEKLLGKDYEMKFKNRIEERIHNELQEQEANGMEIVEPEKDEYSEYVRGMLGSPDTPNFHGEFSEMEAALQDAIINPKHYKMIPKSAYTAHPEGLEYMDLMEYILDHHSGVESHLLGQVFKYACRLGKKDAKLQDAKKIEWYANRLVKVIESQDS